jgi:hypothetical protein
MGFRPKPITIKRAKRRPHKGVIPLRPAVRYFVGFTAVGASVGPVARLYQRGGSVTMLNAFAAL